MCIYTLHLCCYAICHIQLSYSYHVSFYIFYLIKNIFSLTTNTQRHGEDVFSSDTFSPTHFLHVCMCTYISGVFVTSISHFSAKTNLILIVRLPNGWNAAVCWKWFYAPVTSTNCRNSLRIRNMTGWLQKISYVLSFLPCRHDVDINNPSFLQRFSLGTKRCTALETAVTSLKQF